MTLKQKDIELVIWVNTNPNNINPIFTIYLYYVHNNIDNISRRRIKRFKKLNIKDIAITTATINTSKLCIQC